MESSSRFPSDWLLPDWPAPPGVRAVFTTRSGGVSAPPFDSLNLGTHVGDAPAAVEHNRALLQHALGVQPTYLQQVHGTALVCLTGPAGAGPVREPPVADAAWSCEPAAVCTVMVADCLPVLLCSQDGRRVAAAHAGWRGLAGEGGLGILESVLEPFGLGAQVNAASSAMKVIAWLGPCIGPSAFEVGPEVRAAFLQRSHDGAAARRISACFTPTGASKYLADLAALARLRLAALGVHAVYGNDSSRDWCTVANASRFFSYRRDGVCGRMAACIWRS